MKPTKFIWVDGFFVPWKKAQIHLMSHTLHYGSGAFEGIRLYNTTQGTMIFRLSDHVKRLIDSFSLFKKNLPWDEKTIKQAIIKTVKINEINEGYIRPLMFFGDESLGVNPLNCSIHLAIMVFEWNKFFGKNSINVMTSSIKRLSHESTNLHKKITGHYVNSIQAHQEARRLGFDEALLLDNKNNITECSIANFFIIEDGIIKTPSTETLLPGITRDTIITLAKDNDLEVQETSLHKSNILRACEAFLTGTASEITPIKRIDEISLKSEKVTKRLQKLFYEVIQDTPTQYDSWFTFVEEHK